MKTIAEQLASGATLIAVPLDQQPPEGWLLVGVPGPYIGNRVQFMHLVGDPRIAAFRLSQFFECPVTLGDPVPGRDGSVWGDVRCVLGTEVAGECARIGQAIPIGLGDADKWFWLAPVVPQYPIGTRIKFKRQLDCGPTEEHPAQVYAYAGEPGEITGHGCREGYWVKADRWNAPFGASAEEFEVVPVVPEKGGE